MQGLVSGYAYDYPVARANAWGLALPASLAAHAVFFTGVILASLLRTAALPEVQAAPPPLTTWPRPTLVRAVVTQRPAAGGGGSRRTALPAPTEAATVASPREIVPTEEPSSHPTPDTEPATLDHDDPGGGHSDGSRDGDPNGRGSNPGLEPGPGPGTAVRPGGVIQAPSKLRHVDPVYPELARVTRLQGTVLLECIIDIHGRVVGTRVLKSVPLLDRAALDAVQRWEYAPTRLNGVPVAVVMTVTVRFTLSSASGR